MTTALPDSITQRIERLCSEGEAFAADDRMNAAVLRYTTALRLLPRPQDRWQVTPRVLASIIELCFDKGDYLSAREAALAALECPTVAHNPALHLKLGAIYFEEGNLTAAREQFAQALAGGGQEVFDDEDPKYWDFMSSGELQN